MASQKKLSSIISILKVEICPDHIFHSACPCKKLWPEVHARAQKTSFKIYLFCFVIFFYLVTRDQQSKQKKSHKNNLAAVFDCKTIIVGYYNTVEPPNKGLIGSRTFVPCSEVCPISEVTVKFCCNSLIDCSSSYLSFIS